MRDFLPVVIFSLISASAAVMAPTTTREFHCFPQSWEKADQVRVSCNDTQIAQYCPGQSCRNMSKPGVSLENGRNGVCLTITSCSYDSWSCQALCYISDREYKEKFTVNVCNQPARTLPSPGSTSTSATSGSTSTSATSGSTSTSATSGSTSTSATSGSTSTSATSGSTSTSPSPGNNESHSGSIAAGVTVGSLIIFSLMFGILYHKVKCLRKAIRDYLPCMNRTPKKEQDIEMQEKKRFLESPNHDAK